MFRSGTRPLLALHAAPTLRHTQSSNIRVWSFYCSFYLIIREFVRILHKDRQLCDLNHQLADTNRKVTHLNIVKVVKFTMMGNYKLWVLKCITMVRSVELTLWFRPRTLKHDRTHYFYHWSPNTDFVTSFVSRQQILTNPGLNDTQSIEYRLGYAEGNW